MSKAKGPERGMAIRKDCHITGKQLEGESVIDVRICFGLAWYTIEAEADRAAAEVVKRGLTYNGGFYHGMACGRDKSWDYKDAERTPHDGKSGGVKRDWYAVTF